MRRLLILILAFAISGTAFSQDNDKVLEYIEAGVVLHDQGDYKGAIKKYDAALKLDKNNLLALGEKAFSLFRLQEYTKCIEVCELALDVHDGDPGLRSVYTTLGNSYDAISKPTKSIKVYEKGLKQFPDDYMLHFNQGITLINLDKPDDAILSFQNAMTYNPEHPGSHNALARMEYDQNKIPSLMAFCRFLVLEPEGSRAEANFPLMKATLGGGVEKTGDNTITINIDASTLNTGKKKGKAENDFSTIQMIMSLTSALDFEEENKDKTDVELFQNKMEKMVDMMDENLKENSGFYWEYYVPYFIALKKAGHMETFSYLVFATDRTNYIQDWLSGNKIKIKEFYGWDANYAWAK